MRIESDFLGEKNLPDDALFGIQSMRAEENFALNYRKISSHLLRAMLLVKKAAASAYEQIETKVGQPENAEKYLTIVRACDYLMENGEETDKNFITDALQGGAGTSANMNVNEVIANTALRLMRKPLGAYHIIHPIDHVNRGQSTNDVFPTSLRIAAILLLRELSGQCAKLQESLQKKETEWANVKKLGRTELMDALPITLGEEFGSYAQAIARDRWRLYKIEERLRQVNLGGTAVGKADNADRQYRVLVYEFLREWTGIGLASAEYPMDITQNNDVFVEVSGLLKALAVNLSKIAGDIRLMNSGPGGGLGELTAQALQIGSTIMPGKVNPIISEMTIQVSIKVQANDFAITVAAGRGEFELNAFLPLIADALLESLSLLERAVFLFRTKCIDTLIANVEQCKKLLDSSTAFAATFIPILGYNEVARVVRKYGRDAEQILVEMANNNLSPSL
ncbi:MAG: aspartate ammonia-lyase [Treponema sp.]|jgi:aspartate ammonia-lyase|nr:aspartate ammonia-lyase [Treponema sp.]